MGLDPVSGAEAKRRLLEVGIIDKNWQPVNWSKRQFFSDNSTPRVRKLRIIKKTGNGIETPINRYCNAPDTEQNRPDTEQIKPLASSAKIALSANGLWENISVEMRSAWERAHPAVNLDTELAKAAAWILANPKNVKKNYAKFLTNWLARSQDRAPRVNQTTTGKIGRALEACKKAYAT